MSRWLRPGLAVLLVPALAVAQGASLRGTVKAGGAPLPNAQVVLSPTGRGALTDATGSFRFTQLPAGEYIVSARALGRQPVTQAVTLRGGVAATVELELREAGVAFAQVVVTADREVSDIVKVPASVSVLSPDYIETRAAVQPGDELLSTAGVLVTRPYDGETAYITMRGVPNRHSNDTFLGLVDGVPMVTANDEVDLARLVLPSLLQRVEVVKGPVSALYGRGGIAGAVHYITRPAFGAPRFEGGILSGSYGLLRPYASAALELVPGKNALLVSALAERREGWRESSDRSLSNLFVKNDWTLGARTTLATTFNLQASEGRNPSHIPLDSLGRRATLPRGEDASFQIPNNGVDRTLWMATSTLRRTMSDVLELRVTGHARYTKSDANLGFADSYDAASNTLSWNGFNGITRNHAAYGEAQATWRPIPAMRVITGTSIERQSGHADEFWTGQYGFDPETFTFYFYRQDVDARTGRLTNSAKFIRDQLLNADFRATIGAAYAQADLELSQRARLTLGARWDRFSRDVDFGVTTEEGKPQPTGTGDDRDSHLSPKVSLDVSLTDHVAAWTSFSEGFSPAFGPVWAFRNRERTLKPEVARNLEVGLKGHVLDGRASFTAALFRLQRLDLLQLVPNPGGVPKPANAGEGRSSGLEVETQFALGAPRRGLSGFANYTLTKAEWIDNKIPEEFGDDVFDFSGKEATGIPRHFWSAGITQRLGKATLGTWIDYTGSSWMTPQNTIRNPAYLLANATASWSPSFLRNGTFLLTATNLFDRRYYVNFSSTTTPTESYPGRRRELVATVRWTH